MWLLVSAFAAGGSSRPRWSRLKAGHRTNWEAGAKPLYLISSSIAMLESGRPGLLPGNTRSAPGTDAARRVPTAPACSRERDAGGRPSFWRQGLSKASRGGRPRPTVAVDIRKLLLGHAVA
jgi:hypothetical protein